MKTKTGRVQLGWLTVLSLGLLVAVDIAGSNDTVQAQTVSTDTTTGTVVDASASDRFTITGGAIQGQNLFHSFEAFSPQAAETRFDLEHVSYGGAADAVNVIFSRVTGLNASNLNGLLEVVGGDRPSFFLLNPNGIVLGAGSTLSVPGSIVLSTAERLVFEDKTHFSADLMAGSSLTLSVPIGLQFGATAAPIAFDGTRPISPSSSNTRPSPTVFEYEPETDFEYEPETALTFLGGGLTFEQAFIRVPSGRIQLGSVESNTTVAINADTHQLTYPAADQRFRDIHLLDSIFAVNSEFIDNELPSGSISLVGRRLQMDSADLDSVNIGNQDGGSIFLNFSESISLTNLSGIAGYVDAGGTSSGDLTPSRGRGSNVEIITKDLLVEDSLIFTDIASANSFRTQLL